MNYEELLNEEQLLPVYETEGPVLVLAGAGSGKTRVLTYRIAHLIEKGVNPYSILAITFTNKAAKEMQERIENVTGKRGMQISTFHSFCTRVLRQDIEALGIYTKNFSIYDDDNTNKIISRIVKELNIQDEKKTFAKEVRGHISHAKNYGFDPIAYSKTLALNPKRGDIIKVFVEYQKQLITNNALDFDDLLLLTVKLFAERPDVLEKYQLRYQYIHVDEFQDTNKIQYLILKMLASKFYNVFAVGDDDQSIYGWRGADYSNIRKFSEQFLGCKIFKLQRNYRSTKQILDAANKLISNNKKRMGKNLWTEESDGTRIEYKVCEQERDEADYVLGQINGLIKHNDYRYSDFAILVRTTSITREVEEKLNLYGFPYRLIGGHKFYDRKEIKDFLAYMQIIANKKDNESLLRIINTPRRGIGDGAIEKLKKACEELNCSLIEGLLNFDKLNLSGTTKAKLGLFAGILYNLESKSDLPIDEFADYINEIVDFKSMYDEKKEEDKDRLENIDELLTSIKGYVKDNPNAGISEYLQSVTLITSEDKDDKLSKDVITVATVHGVKGLEFRCVFIIGLEDGIFPIRRVDTTLDELEEERRIMYVAITRAKERLYFTHTKSRFRFGVRDSTIPSQFIKEAGLNPKGYVRTSDFIETPVKNKFYDFMNVMKKETPSFATKPVVQPALDKDLSKFKVGQNVNHSRFGLGKIIAISGENADIQFPGLGVKKFNMRLAPITIVRDDR